MQTRSFQALDDSFSPSVCRSMSVTPSRRYLQVPSPVPLGEPDVSIGVQPLLVLLTFFKASDEAGDAVSSDDVSSQSSCTRDGRVMFRHLVVQRVNQS